MPQPFLIVSLMRPQGDTGVQTHVRVLRDWLLRQGRAVHLVTPFDCPHWQIYPVFGLRRLLDRLHKEASVWWYRHWHAVFLQRALRKQLAADLACVIYAQCPLSARAALRARKSRAQKVVMVMHFNLSQADEWSDKGAILRDGKLFRSIRLLEENILPLVDGLVFVSDYMRRELEQRIPAIARVQSKTIPNFINDPGEPVKLAERSDLITVGTLRYRKNQRYALEIVQAATQLGRKLSLTVVGDGPDRALLEKFACAENIDKQVRFMGFVSDAAALMPAHRACLHVSRMESFGIVLIEAMSRGLPVFAPAAGGMPEVFDDGVEGRLIPLDNAFEAARVILEWLNNEKLLQASCTAARRRFLERYEADRVALELAGFLDRVAGV